MSNLKLINGTSFESFEDLDMFVIQILKFRVRRN
jgi:hypothetical protein